MTTNLDAFQELLAGMRAEFLSEMLERCDRFDELILNLEKTSGDRQSFNELFRGVHSLKGSGGTHGLGIITTLCHELENLLTETDARNGFGAVFASRALAYVDVLRRIEACARRSQPDYSAIEAELEALRRVTLERRKACLIVESSTVMARAYQKALAGLPLQLTMVDNGLTGLERLLREPFDIVIAGLELKELNGIAMLSALRAARARNHDIPAILVTSKSSAMPESAGLKAIISRDRNLADALFTNVSEVLNKS